MSQLLRGNFTTKNTVELTAAEGADTVVDQFEREAMRRLGGSITFVSRKKFVWNGETAKKD